MHIILENHVREMANDFEYSDVKDSKLFEYFCNYCVVSSYFFGRFQPSAVTTNEDDASIDGIAIIVDGDLIETVDDADQIFGSHKTSMLVDVVITQVKSGEAFKKDEIANFKMGLDDYLTLDPQLPNGDLNKESIEILKIVFQNLKKVRNRLPNCHVYYCTSGTVPAKRGTEAKEITAALKLLRQTAEKSGFFHSVTTSALGRAELLRMYGNLTERSEAKLKLIDYIGMPEMPGIPQSYMAIVKAKDYVDSLLVDEIGGLKESVFEENVRSYLGGNNDVNQAIQATLRDGSKKSLFSVLNNGITIVAPDLTLTPNTKEVSLTNYQVINGCQTSSTLHENYSALSDDVNIVVKLIQAPDNDVSEDIIAATNSQSDIPKHSFYGLRGKAKLVQKYFNACNEKAAPDSKVYFERRSAEYRNSGYQSTRIFDVREVARCYAAMFLEVPHSSARYVSTIFSVNGESLFRDDDHEGYYYAACLALYKYQTLINGKKIGAPDFVRLRWHVIQVFKWLCHDSVESPQPNSKKADAYSSKIISVLNSEDRRYVEMFDRCQTIIDSVGKPSDDELKRARFSAEIRVATQAILPKKAAKAK